MARALLLLFFISSCYTAYSQSCDLGFENFTGSNVSNPPAGWTRGPGTNIANTFDNDPQGIAVGFNAIGEWMTSPSYSCIGQVCFDHRSSGTTSEFEIMIGAFQPMYNDTIYIDTIMFTGSTGQNMYQQYCIDIDSSLFIAPFDMRIFWIMTDRSGGTYYFDNVCFSSGTCVVEPTQFAFTSTPNGCIQTNTPTAITVCATDANGYVAEDYIDNITLSVNSGPGNISGTISGAAVDGCLDAIVNFDMEGDYTVGATSTANAYIGTSPLLSVMDQCPNEDTLRIMSYNLLNYPNGRDDCGPNTVVPARWDTLAKIVAYAKPDILMVCELQNEAGADSILSKALNVNGITYYAPANFIANQSTSQIDFNNMMFYNSEKVTLYSQSEILTNTRDFNKYVVYANDPTLAVTQDTTFIDLYMAHLKAGSASADSIRRAEDCQILRDTLDQYPERNMILGGDLNFYTNQEQAYQTLRTGLRPFLDPSYLEGPWENNAQYATVHTQSSRGSSDPTFDCGFNGGSDSRFDFLLASGSIMNETMNVGYLPNTYKTVGNNGSTFNKAINDPANTSGVPSSVLNAMYYMSDHLPVIMDVKISYPIANTTCGIVNNINNAGPGSLRYVIECTSPGDTVRFDPSINNATIFLLLTTVTIDKDITLYAPGQNIVIYADDPSIPSTLTINAGVTLNIDGLQIIGESAIPGSAIVNNGTLNLKATTITNSQNAPSCLLNKDTGVINVLSNSTIKESEF